MIASFLLPGTALAVEPFGGGFGIGETRGIAVDEKEHGDVYTSGERINEFTSAGAFVRAFGWGVVPGAASGTGDIAAESKIITNFTTTAGAFVPGGALGQIVTGPGIPPETRVAGYLSTSLELTKAATSTTPGATVSVEAGPGNVPTNERELLTVKATSGSFTLTFGSPAPGSTYKTTSSLPYSAGAAQVQAALEALSNIGPGNVSVSGGPGDETGSTPYAIEFTGRWADTNVRKLAVSTSGFGGGVPASGAAVSTAVEGGGAMETCTSVCGPSSQNNPSDTIEGAPPGQFSNSDEIAADNYSGSPSYGDVYLVNGRDLRVEKYSPAGTFLLMFGSGVDQGPHHPGDVCTAEYLAEGDECGPGVPGSGPGQFSEVSSEQSWWREDANSIAVGPAGRVYVGDLRRVEEFSETGEFLGERQMPTAQSQFVDSLAVDPGGNVYASSPPEDEAVEITKPASGFFTLTFEGESTAPLSAESSTATSAEEIATALEHLPKIGEGNVHVEEYPSAPRRARVRFFKGRGQRNLPEISTSAGTVRTLIEGAEGELVKLGPSGELLHTYQWTPLGPSNDPYGSYQGDGKHLALDEEGNLVVSEAKEADAGSHPSGSHLNFYFKAGFRVYSPSGALIAELSSDQVQNLEAEVGSTGLFDVSANNPMGVAVGRQAEVIYAMTSSPARQIVALPLPAPGPPTVASESVSDILPRTAMLHALVNPSEFDTEYHFEVVDDAHYQSEGFSGPSTVVTPTEALGRVERNYQVQAALSGLSTGTKYRYRVVAHSTSEGGTTVYGPAETFETLPPVSIRGLTTQTVGPELVTLKAELNPNASLAPTHYRFLLGADEKEGALPTGNEFVQRTATFSGLQPNTTYHYRLVASNEFGETETSDRTLKTEPSAAEERAAEECPNTVLREENNSLPLPDCRAYEQATARDKGAGEAFGKSSFAPGGERVLYQSEGVFAGAQGNELTISYLAQRTGAGWTTMPVISRPAPAGTEPIMTPNELQFSPELDRWLFGEVPAQNHLEALYKMDSAYLSMGLADGSVIPHATGEYSVIEGEPRQYFAFFKFAQHSDDLSHVYLIQQTRLLPAPGDPRPDDYDKNVVAHASRIYELSGVGGSEPRTELVAEMGLGLVNRATCGIDQYQHSFAHAPEREVSTDGSTLFYEMGIEHLAGANCGPGTSNPIGLFVHQAKGPSVQVNTPLPSQCSEGHPCASASSALPTFDGTSADGSRGWFTTAQPLIDSDTDATGDLYLAKVENGEVNELVQASAGEATPSHPSPGAGAGVQGVLRVSEDGSHVAFVATGVLTAEANPTTGAVAEAGADNLYVYDAATGTTKFVAVLCSGSGKSGSVADPSCPGGSDAGLWQESTQTVRITPNGNALLFDTWGRLTASDTDNVQDVYRYDFATGELLRITFGRNGNDGNGNDDAFGVELPYLDGALGAANEQSEDSHRAMSDDGSVAIFETAAPLVARDTNEANDVYEWEEDGHGTCREEEGCVRLVSDGVDPHGAEGGIVSASGKDVLFHTLRGEIPADADGVGDLYDARVEGGFPTPVAPAVCGSPETCHAPPPPSPPSPPMSSEEFQGGGNGPTQLHCAKGKRRVTRHGQERCVPRKRHRKHHGKRSRRRPANVNGRAAK